MGISKYLILIIILSGCIENTEEHAISEDDPLMYRSVDEVFEYQVFHATVSGQFPEKGDTVSLLHEIPYLLISEVIPSKEILNEILATGLQDAGMSGGAKWQPYNISQSEFEKLVKSLKLEDPKLEYIAPPSWVRNFDDWGIWIQDIKYGVPWKEHKRLNDRYLSIVRKADEHRKNRYMEKADQLEQEAFAAGNEVAQYHMRHVKRK